MHHFNFPILTSFGRRHDNYRPFFRRSLELHSSLNKTFNHEDAHFTQNQFVENQENQAFLHWKKAVRKRYESDCMFPDITSQIETNPADGQVQNFRSEGTLASQWLFNKSFGRLSPCALQTQYCYLNYFSEPKMFNKTAKFASQFECKFCSKWFGEVKEKMDIYLDNLKSTTKVAEVGKRRGRKSKSMSRRVCELCSKILSNRKGLERHMLIHTGEKPFSCEICGKPFRRKDNCVRHTKTAHLFKKPRKPRRRRDQPSTTLEKPTLGLKNW